MRGTARKEQLRLDAIRRQDARYNRTNEQQIKLLDNRPGESRKERSKLG